MVIINGKKDFRKGFSLAEILVVILIMGLAVTGLLNFLEWGQERYFSLSEGWQNRGALVHLQRFLRNSISRGETKSLTKEILLKELKKMGNWRIADFSVKQFPPNGVFVRTFIFLDLNKNGIFDKNEFCSPQTWCFRMRTEL